MNDQELKRLLAEIRAGNPEALGPFYQEFVSRLVPFFISVLRVSPQDAEDFTQDVVLRFWSTVQRGGAQELESVGGVKAYLKTAAKSVFLDWIRKQRTRTLSESIDEETEFPALTPEELTITNRIQEEIAAETALGELSDVQWRAVILYERYGLTYLEIAEVERCDRDTVRSRLQQARANIAKLLC